ncbi:carbohydrate kinase family protein [Kitasatospora camelliae]|uniref:Carbohydrate kinase family protein n=1 Tax=Kitasatospora camelliae TaxID=3156397 RepID=A0AAU8JQ44_9ACTN
METDGSGRGCEVLVAGPYFADLVFHGLPRPVEPGGEVFAGGFAFVPGGAYTLAMAVHRLGRRVVWGADFGTDPFSAEVLAAARAEGLDESAFRHHRFPVRSVTVALSGPEDRAMVSYQDPLPARPLVPLLHSHRPEAMMLPQLRWDAEALEACQAARRLGALVAMDSHDVPATLADPFVRRALAGVDVFTPNAAEALRLTGARTVDGAVAELADLVPMLVVKRGERGATAVHGGRRYDVPSAAVRAVDTTSAGDCFNAGLVHGMLAGWDLPACLAAAAACGAAATTGPGSSAALRGEELPQWLERIPDHSEIDVHTSLH